MVVLGAGEVRDFGFEADAHPRLSLHFASSISQHKNMSTKITLDHSLLDFVVDGCLSRTSLLREMTIGPY